MLYFGGKSSQFLTLRVSDYGEALKTSADQDFAIVFACCFSGNKVKRRLDIGAPLSYLALGVEHGEIFANQFCIP
jgi:hypothetical protein